MTREEAISILWRYDVNFEPHPAEDVMHAIDMAIEALRNKNDLPISPLLKEPKQPENGSEQSGNTEQLDGRTTDDCISRQAAIDILYDFAGCIVDTPNGDYQKAYQAYRHRLEILPSVQPEVVKDTNVPINDCVSRQAAIDKINERQRKLIYCFGFENDAVKIMDIAKSIVIAIPSAQPVIIRCKDCRYWREYKYVNGRPKFLPRCGFHQTYVREDDFCSAAERRTDE